MPDETQQQKIEEPEHGTWSSGAFGPGLLLVMLPSIALVGFMPWFSDKPAVGLPIVAVFGIMILFGAMALVSTLFARLKMGNKAEALALPAGSIRAFIALALIVLFALISVMLFESFGQTHEIENLSEQAKNALVAEPANRVSAVIPICPSATGSAPSATERTAGAAGCVYTVHVLKARDPGSADLSKQLLILIGTLMTSVVSFYFASRSGEANMKNIITAMGGKTLPNTSTDTSYETGKGGKISTDASGDREQIDTGKKSTTPDPDDTADGCDVPVVDATADQDLPPSTGGTTR